MVLAYKRFKGLYFTAEGSQMDLSIDGKVEIETYDSVVVAMHRQNNTEHASFLSCWLKSPL